MTETSAVRRRTVLRLLGAGALGATGASTVSGTETNHDRSAVSGVIRGIVDEGSVRIGERRTPLSGTAPDYELTGIKPGTRQVRVTERRGTGNRIRRGGALRHRDEVEVSGETTYDVHVDSIRFTYIRPPTDLDEMKAQIDNLAEAGITDLFVESFFHGETIFPSAIATEKPYDDDFFGNVIDYAHRQGMRIHAWVETLYWANPLWLGDPPEGHILDGDDEFIERGAEYTVDSDLITVDRDGRAMAEDGKIFVSPFNDEVVDTIQAIVAEIDEYDVDGVSVDYIRFPAGFFWHPRSYGYEDAGPFEEGMDDDDLHGYRTTAITDLAADIGDVVDEETVYSASVFPGYYLDQNDDFERFKSQDWKAWIDESRIDWLLPMCYALDPTDEDHTLDVRGEEVAFSYDAEAEDVTVLPIVAATSGHPDIQTQFEDLIANHNRAGYGVWDNEAVMEDDSYDDIVP